MTRTPVYDVALAVTYRRADDQAHTLTFRYPRVLVRVLQTLGNVTIDDVSVDQEDGQGEGRRPSRDVREDAHAVELPMTKRAMQERLSVSGETDD